MPSARASIKMTCAARLTGSARSGVSWWQATTWTACASRSFARNEKLFLPARTVKIARSELSAICHAVGVMQPRDSVELHNLPLVIVVKLKKREDTGELTNEIKGYERKASAGQAQQAPVTDNTPPWKR